MLVQIMTHVRCVQSTLQHVTVYQTTQMNITRCPHGNKLFDKNSQGG